ncbi:hypothetical protein HUT03_00375 [Candidatus Liberibacter africanus]|uniref:hypothetical protein n=1 Tax=Liberibacter africanus TaxID=34020 RepID=UPI000699B6F1|nr:hypothetical protein [Candidatus Liberibacter africanus]QTP63614.1 hypothetical protein HUT03_00375 [Candidatus Liberibacter africanus]
MTNQAYRQNAERDRKQNVILEIIRSEALKGKVYSARQFREVFEGEAGLGSESSIQRILKVLMTQGRIKIFKNIKDYSLPTRRSFKGFMCVKDMNLLIDNDKLVRVTPTDYKCKQTGKILPVENSDVWVEHD